MLSPLKVHLALLEVLSGQGRHGKLVTIHNDLIGGHLLQGIPQQEVALKEVRADTTLCRKGISLRDATEVGIKAAG